MLISLLLLLLLLHHFHLTVSTLIDSRGFNFSRHELLIEASLSAVDTFNMWVFLDQQRTALFSDYEHMNFISASQQLTNIIGLRKEFFVDVASIADMTVLSWICRQLGTTAGSTRALSLLDQAFPVPPVPSVYLGDYGYLYESVGSYTLAITYFRKDLLAKITSLQNPRKAVMPDDVLGDVVSNDDAPLRSVSEQHVARCRARRAWRVQDDLLAETNSVRLLARISEDPDLTHSSTLFLKSAAKEIVNKNLLAGSTTTTNGSSIVQAQWLWVRKNVIVVALEKDLTLIDPGSGTVGVIDRHNCVVLTRNDEHMEGWREYSRMKADNTAGGYASWGYGAENTTRSDDALHRLAADPNTTIVPLLGAFSFRNHFHWIADVMARLVIFRQVFLKEEKKTNQHVVGLIPAWVLGTPSQNMQRVSETAMLMGVPLENLHILNPDEGMVRIKSAALIEWRREGSVECDGYIRSKVTTTTTRATGATGATNQEQNSSQQVPPQCWRKWDDHASLNSVHIPPGSVLRKLRETVWHFSSSKDMREQDDRSTSYTRPYILFVHRGELALMGRSFTNPKETIDAIVKSLRARLSDYDVIAVNPGGLLSLDEQVKLFRFADGVVGPHGAGLTNIVFSRPGTVVVELPTTEHAGMLFFQDFSNALGLLHAIVPDVACNKFQHYDLDEKKIGVIVETMEMMLEEKKKIFY